MAAKKRLRVRVGERRAAGELSWRRSVHCSMREMAAVLYRLLRGQNARFEIQTASPQADPSGAYLPAKGMKKFHSAGNPCLVAGVDGDVGMLAASAALQPVPQRSDRRLFAVSAGGRERGGLRFDDGKAAANIHSHSLRWRRIGLSFVMIAMPAPWGIPRQGASAAGRALAA
eukprot:TRINITY_DN38470_c0_g1_i1.p1 TRINITY_DN38470_c0_g1~~TRINITY_DN38470_c0_g1_i1.p1  ORF type:complete len:172 (+),score=17.23 TRINITY_DN38470_c0_g1_i1:1-516(+)